VRREAAARRDDRCAGARCRRAGRAMLVGMTTHLHLQPDQLYVFDARGIA
jgi:hypothetical protein